MLKMEAFVWLTENWFSRTSYIQVQFTITKIFLSVNWTMTGERIFLHLYLNSTKLCSNFLLHWSFHVTILETVTLRLSFVTLFAKSTNDCAITCEVFSDGRSLVPTWNMSESARKLSQVNFLFVVKFFYFPTLHMFYNGVFRDKNFFLFIINHYLVCPLDFLLFFFQYH